jgi:hypothetical protein
VNALAGRELVFGVLLLNALLSATQERLLVFAVQLLKFL